jgi:hydroxypyruvate isomerase
MPDPPFAKGVNNRNYHDEVITRSKSAIDRCVEFRVPNVIAFTGYKWLDAENPQSGAISDAEAIENSVRALRSLGEYAGSKGVTVCLEHLNSRDDSDPMKGHPGYHGDNLDLCAEIIRRVASEHVKLLFDIYHVQVMHGDVIRRMRGLAGLIGHVHIAGNPGRGELCSTQELFYPAIVKTLGEIGYQGFIGHEFIPVGDPIESLSEALQACEIA